MHAILYWKSYDNHIFIIQVSNKTSICNTYYFQCMCVGVSNLLTHQPLFNYRCLQYMSDYGSCLLQGYGVLPGPPSRVKAPLIASHFAIVEWSAPKILAETVTSYHVHIRKLGMEDEYSVLEKDHPPYIIESLDSGTYYEAFIVAMNAHGKGAPSPRLIFQTKRESEESLQSSPPSYNITSCCTAANVLPQCMPLCTYDLKISDLQLLGQTCSMQMGVLSKCAAGGRDHTPCCNRRGVPTKCLSLCRGIVPQPPVNCLPYGGNIIQCFEEGMCLFFIILMTLLNK